jgi:hypothetical protein
MHRFWAASFSALAAAATTAMPPEPVPISTAAAPRDHVAAKYMDDVEGLARLTWQATNSPSEHERLAAVEQMARVCAHPRRVDRVLASVESKEPHPVIKQAATRIRVSLRLETKNMVWVDQENAAAEGRSVVAHDPIPYREALASLRHAEPPPQSMGAAYASPAMQAPTPSPNAGRATASDAQQKWAADVAKNRAANAQNLPKRGK